MKLRRSPVIVASILGLTIAALFVPYRNALYDEGMITEDEWQDKWRPIEKRWLSLTLDPRQYDRQVIVRIAQGYIGDAILPYFEVESYVRSGHVLAYVDSETFAELHFIEENVLDGRSQENYSIMKTWIESVSAQQADSGGRSRAADR